MKIRVFSVLLIIFSLALFYGCGGDPPTADLEAASKALQDARAAGAEKFAASDFGAAQRAYDEAEKEVQAESDKMFKNFEKAQGLIADASSKAGKAKSAAMAAKSRAKSAAQAMIADAAAAVQQARESLEGAPAGKGTEGDIEQLRADLGAADADLSAARSAVAAENFEIAESRAGSAKQKAQAVASGVEAATQKYAEMVKKMKPWYER